MIVVDVRECPDARAVADEAAGFFKQYPDENIYPDEIDPGDLIAVRVNGGGILVVRITNPEPVIFKGLLEE